MIEGRIVKGIGGFYYVRTEQGLIECKPRGIFRKQDITPLVGDIVKISIIEGSQLQGFIHQILPRKTLLRRPAVANVEQCVAVISVDQPEPDLLFLDRLLVVSEANGLENVICFNKIDLDAEEKYQHLAEEYRRIGYTVVCTSALTGEGIGCLKNLLKDRISVFSGLSGVGKSSLLNSIQPSLRLRTGQISQKLRRGRHTTRHAELLELEIGGMVVDTPGFSLLKLSALEESGLEIDNLSRYFPEFDPFTGKCRFNGCRHIKEPDCMVKKAVEQGEIAKWRYENYITLMAELEEGRRRKYD